MIDPFAKENTVRGTRKYKFGDFVIDPERHSLMQSGTPVSIEPKVFDLLLLLVKNAGKLISRDTLIQIVWQGRIVSESAISINFLTPISLSSCLTYFRGGIWTAKPESGV